MKKVIVWFEIPVIDFTRAKKFYSKIMQFDMKEETLGSDQMGFFPGEKGEISGAIVKGEGFEPGGKGTIVYLNGDENLQVILNRVEPAGGKIIAPKTQIAEEHGYYAWFLDTEGNKLGLWSEK
jgi:predicted enzyme related to lactoylglutathione lyase